MTQLYNYWQQPASALAIEHPPSCANPTTGYIDVRRDHRKRRLHVWLWEQLVGPIPEGMQVDHINGIRTDCRMSNLRLVSQVVNSRNRGKPRNNTSGITGVTLMNIKGASYWAAHWKHPTTGKRQIKYFSVAKLGDAEAKRLATEHRESIMVDLRANHEYTDRHGL